MKILIVPLFAFLASPAFADVYRCTSGNKTIYQDVPCAKGKLVENINGQEPSQAAQMKALDQAAKERALTARLRQDRETNDRMASPPQVTSATPAPPATPSNQTNRTSGRPDRYYDRPDRYKYRR